jgi:hypothetical protein
MRYLLLLFLGVLLMPVKALIGATDVSDNLLFPIEATPAGPGIVAQATLRIDDPGGGWGLPALARGEGVAHVQ